MDDLGADEALKQNVGALDALSKPKGSRPDPKEYLDTEDFENLTSKFNKDGIASRIVLKDDYLEFGIGKPDIGKTEYVAPKNEIDEILKLSVEEQARKLGIPVDQIQSGQLARIDFKVTKSNPVEMPTGNEFATNNNWIPGGKTSGGVSEAVIKTDGMKINIDFKVTDL